LKLLFYSVNVKLWGCDRFLEENVGCGPKKIEINCPNVYIVKSINNIIYEYFILIYNNFI